MSTENTQQAKAPLETQVAGPTLLDGLDPDIVSKLTARRGLFAKAATALGGLATAPLVLAAASKEAFALLEFALPKQIIDVLNFALLAEYLESEFYTLALNAPGLIPAQYRTVFRTIGTHEDEHVVALKTVLGIAAIRKPKFDYTAGGRYPDIFSNFRTFLSVSQMFEDTGVRAYKGQAPNLMSNGLILTTALRIHSVEARHAAEVRRVRGVKPWDGGAFDEPLSRDAVLARISPFVADSVRIG